MRRVPGDAGSDSVWAVAPLNDIPTQLVEGLRPVYDCLHQLGLVDLPHRALTHEKLDVKRELDGERATLFDVLFTELI